MTDDSEFRCSVCDGAIHNPHFCFDRRIEHVTVHEHDGKPVTTINIAERETLFLYCSSACWEAHEPDIAVAMQLLHPYPAFSFVTPCSRCARPVNRTHHYVCYSISEMLLEEQGELLIGHCINDKDYAVLCSGCEEPGENSAEREDRVEEEKATTL
jgi:hypothetical protein